METLSIVPSFINRYELSKTKIAFAFIGMRAFVFLYTQAYYSRP